MSRRDKKFASLAGTVAINELPNTQFSDTDSILVPAFKDNKTGKIDLVAYMNSYMKASLQTIRLEDYSEDSSVTSGKSAVKAIIPGKLNNSNKTFIFSELVYNSIYWKTKNTEVIKDFSDENLFTNTPKFLAFSDKDNAAQIHAFNVPSIFDFQLAYYKYKNHESTLSGVYFNGYVNEKASIVNLKQEVEKILGENSVSKAIEVTPKDLKLKMINKELIPGCKYIVKDVKSLRYVDGTDPASNIYLGYRQTAEELGPIYGNWRETKGKRKRAFFKYKPSTSYKRYLGIYNPRSKDVEITDDNLSNSRVFAYFKHNIPEDANSYNNFRIGFEHTMKEYDAVISPSWLGSFYGVTGQLSMEYDPDNSDNEFKGNELYKVTLQGSEGYQERIFLGLKKNSFNVNLDPLSLNNSIITIDELTGSSPATIMNLAPIRIKTPDLSGATDITVSVNMVDSSLSGSSSGVQKRISAADPHTIEEINLGSFTGLSTSSAPFKIALEFTASNGSASFKVLVREEISEGVYHWHLSSSNVALLSYHELAKGKAFIALVGSEVFAGSNAGLGYTISRIDPGKPPTMDGGYLNSDGYAIFRRGDISSFQFDVKNDSLIDDDLNINPVRTAVYDPKTDSTKILTGNEEALTVFRMPDDGILLLDVRKSVAIPEMSDKITMDYQGLGRYIFPNKNNTMSELTPISTESFFRLCNESGIFYPDSGSWADFSLMNYNIIVEAVSNTELKNSAVAIPSSYYINYPKLNNKVFEVDVRFDTWSDDLLFQMPNNSDCFITRMRSKELGIDMPCDFINYLCILNELENDYFALSDSVRGSYTNMAYFESRFKLGYSALLVSHYYPEYTYTKDDIVTGSNAGYPKISGAETDPINKYIFFHPYYSGKFNGNNIEIHGQDNYPVFAPITDVKNIKVDNCKGLLLAINVNLFRVQNNPYPLIEDINLSSAISASIMTTGYRPSKGLTGSVVRSVICEGFNSVNIMAKNSWIGALEKSTINISESMLKGSIESTISVNKSAIDFVHYSVVTGWNIFTKNIKSSNVNAAMIYIFTKNSASNPDAIVNSQISDPYGGSSMYANVLENMMILGPWTGVSGKSIKNGIVIGGSPSRSSYVPTYI